MEQNSTYSITKSSSALEIPLDCSSLQQKIPDRTYKKYFFLINVLYFVFFFVKIIWNICKNLCI